MANEKFTQLPTVVNASLSDIIAAVQSGTSVQETLQQVFTLMLANIILHNAGNPNGSVAGVVYELCWDTTNLVMYVCTTGGNAATAVWTLSGSVTFPIPLSKGGTNANLTANNGGIFYSTATAGAILLGTATANQIILSGATAAPSWSTATFPPTTTINQMLYSSAANTVTGLATANSSALVTSLTGVPTWLGPLTNGQIIIGSTGAIPVAASLSAGSNITITPGAGTITIASSGNVTWTEATGATQAISDNNGYIANRGGGVAFSLPATSSVGDRFSIVGKSGVWSITQAAGQQINVGATASTLGVTGTCTAAAATDSASFVCITANTIWQVVGAPQSAGLILA